MFSLCVYYLLYMKYTKELLESAAKQSTSVAEVMRIINCPMSGGGHSHISNKLKKYGIDTSHFSSNVEGMLRAAQKRANATKKKPEEILCVSSSEKRIVRKYLHRALQQIGREYKCERCQISSYNDCPITLEVDHINGDWKDNGPENLRYLCPNCHSQTDTSHRKNMKVTNEQILAACKKYDCIYDIAKSLKENTSHSLYSRIRKVAENNGIKIYSYLEKYETIRAPRIEKNQKIVSNPNWRNQPRPNSRKVTRPSKEELEKMINEEPVEVIGKKLGVSGNAVRKWCKHYGIQTKPVGYWTKIFYAKDVDS